MSIARIYVEQVNHVYLTKRQQPLHIIQQEELAIEKWGNKWNFSNKWQHQQPWKVWECLVSLLFFFDRNKQREVILEMEDQDLLWLIK